VLVVGGTYFSWQVTAEIYDPATGKWTVTDRMNMTRADHTATLLSDGRVLVAGGRSQFRTLNTAEVFDPSTGTWTLTGLMRIARLLHTATILPDGKVLVTGGVGGPHSEYLAASEIYDPVLGTWTWTGSMATARVYHGASALPGGKVLVTGGYNWPDGWRGFSTAEIYDPVTGTWSHAGRMKDRRYYHTETVLLNGSVLVAGGSSAPSIFLASTEIGGGG
jgi:N-acetylneuraminic acid mutarotase